MTEQVQFSLHNDSYNVFLWFPLLFWFLRSLLFGGFKYARYICSTHSMSNANGSPWSHFPSDQASHGQNNAQHAHSDDAKLCLDANVFAFPDVPELPSDSHCPCDSSVDFFVYCSRCYSSARCPDTQTLGNSRLGCFQLPGRVVNYLPFVLRIMHGVSLAILSQLSRIHPPAVGTNWPILCWRAVKHQTNTKTYPVLSLLTCR